MCHGEKIFWLTPVVNNKDNKDRVILCQRSGYIRRNILYTKAVIFNVWPSLTA